jgi:hypothetical protein
MEGRNCKLMYRRWTLRDVDLVMYIVVKMHNTFKIPNNVQGDEANWGLSLDLSRVRRHLCLLIAKLLESLAQGE